MKLEENGDLEEDGRGLDAELTELLSAWRDLGDKERKLLIELAHAFASPDQSK